MRRYDLHVFENLLSGFLFTAFVLFGISWVNAIFLALKRLVGDIQSWDLFAIYVLQMLPDAVLPMLPFSAFISAAFLSSRMLARREFAHLRVCRNKAFPPFAAIRNIRNLHFFGCRRHFALSAADMPKQY